MRGLAGGAGVSVLAVLVAIVSFRQEGREAAQPARDAATPSAEDKAGPAGHHASSGESDATRPATFAPDACGGGERLLDEYRHLYGKHRFRHVIVLVPDPLESGGTELLDLVLEGVEEAVSEGSDDDIAYVHDHRWLPWTDTAASAERCWETRPGLIVYRPLDRADEQPPLVVLVVGETPIWGLRADQFNAAIDLIRVRGAPAGQPESPFLVLGPTYSGTAASLAAVTRGPPVASSSFRIVSGTATALKARQILAPTVPVPEHPCTQAQRGSGRVTYESASATDTCLLEKMEEFLRARGGTCVDDPAGGNIAVFTETSTTYGSVGASQGTELGPKCFHRWKLPPDLASIRESSEKADRQSDSVAAHKLVLRSTLDRLSNSRIRFAGIVAADHRDVLYLAGRFRQQLPDVRIFTLSARIQYLDEKAAPTMNGTLVVHSAPHERNRSMALRNELVRKVYHAGRRLLVDAQLEPEVNVSFIGNGRLWDIDDFPRSARSRAAGTNRSNRPTPPVIWQFTLAAFLVVFAGVVVAVVLGLRAGSRQCGRFWSLVGPCAYPDLRRQDLGIGSALLLACAGPVLLMFESIFARRGQQPDQWAVCAVTSLLTLISIWLFHVLGQWRTRKDPTADSWRLTTLPLFAATTVALVALYVGCGPERRATFYLLSGGSPVLVGLIAMACYALTLWCRRARLRMLDEHRFQADPARRFVNIDPPIAQALGEEKGKNTGLADMEAWLLKGLYHPWKYARAVPIAVQALLLVTIAVPMWIKPPHTLEPGPRNVALIALGVFTALTLSVNLAWFVTAWMRLLRFLNRLAYFPAVKALRDCPERRPRPLEQLLAWSGSSATQLVNPVKMLERLAQVNATVQESARKCRELLERKLSREARSVRPTRCTLVNDLLAASAAATACRDHATEEIRKRTDQLAASLIDLFIPRYVRHLRLFVPPMVLGCLCCVFLASLYFVQPQRLIATVTLFWVAGTVVLLVVSYVSLDLHPVLSAITGSASGKVSSKLTLARKIAVWSVVPVAGYLAADHPEFPLWVSRVLDIVAKSLR